jgi:hypothetical protein
MPALFEGSCSACGIVTDRTPGSYEAVLVDGSAGRLPVHPEDPSLVVLTHPRQFDILREVGLSGRAAHWAGRMVEIDKAVCRSCGRLFELRRLSGGLPALGLWGGIGAVACILAASIGAGALIGGEWQGLVAGACILVALLGATERGLWLLIRWRHPGRAARVDTPPVCPDCGHTAFDKLEARHVRRFVRVKCPACGERAMTYRCSGAA